MHGNRIIRPAIFPVGPSIAYIELTQGLYALVDWDDALWLQDYAWFAWRSRRRGQFYAARNSKVDGRWKMSQMPSVILETEQGMDVDHIHHRTLDNRRSQIRPATRQQNAVNRRRRATSKSGIKGVSWRTAASCWIAQIAVDGKKIYLGRFQDIEEARKVYVEAVDRYHGVFGTVD